ncbi:hypothetical protein DCC79_07005 [bacterium]|nr:MAG: hypothetical protein DCC79_07005 [bacterium]
MTNPIDVPAARRNAMPPGVPARRAGRGARSATLATAVVLASASMAWLSVSSRLAATGRMINDLEAERAELLERRAVALTAYAAASDPRALEQSARALGFAPVAAVERLGVAIAPVAAGGPGLDPRSPLAIMRGAADRAGTAGPAEGGSPDMPALLLSVGAAERAHADEIAPAEASGR